MAITRKEPFHISKEEGIIAVVSGAILAAGVMADSLLLTGIGASISTVGLVETYTREKFGAKISEIIGNNHSHN
jgi:hypothetical protein